MALSAQYALYRAHNEFVRQSLWLSSSVIVPATLAGLSALMGEGVLVASLAYLLGTLATTIPIVLDGRRRFPGFGFGFALPNRVERRAAPLLSFAFWLQSAPSALIASGPILLLGMVGASAVIIARFILIRTVVNLARTVLQLAGVVIGQEGARRVAARDREGLLGVFQEGTYFLGVATAAGSGLLLALGEPIFRLWTGSADLFSQSLFWIGLAPTAVVPVFTVAENVLSNSNRPWPLVVGRLAQLALTIAALVLMPIDRIDIRLMAALSIGEVVGFGLPVCIASTRLTAGLTAGFFAKSIAFAMMAAALTYGATAGIYDALGASLEGLILALVGGGWVALLCIAVMGLTRSRRTLLRAWIARPRAGQAIIAPAATPNNQ
jgi:O-antigen/teichoic acid export membrane protein